MTKRGQVTLFVIIGMMIVVLGGIIFSLSGGIQSSKIDASENPNLFIRDCIEDDFDDLVYLVSMNGGSVSPEFSHEYYGNDVEYLCASSRPYTTCVVQRPFLQSHIEQELTAAIEDKLNSCIESLEDTLKEKGFTVKSDFKGHSVSILPERVALEIDYELTISKTDSNRYTDFTINLNNNLYELIGVARSIVEWETLWGDAEIKEYSAIYHYLDIRKNRVSDEDKIYTIEDRSSGDKFQFASRSLVFPPGIN